MARNYSNIAVDTTLAAGIGAGNLSLTVASATGWPAAPFAAVLDPGAATEEVVQVTVAAGTLWTITRGFDGTTAAAHALGVTVRHAAIAGDFTDLQAADTSEASTRAAADTALSNSITSEAGTRAAADTTLQGNITAEAAARAAADALRLLIASNLSDVNNVATARANIGAAPLTPTYITTAANSELSAEVVIPGMSASPDIKGAAGAGTSREFESGDTAPTASSAPAAIDVGATFASHLYIQMTDSAERFFTYSWSPAGAFDVRCKLCGAVNNTSSSPDFGLMVANTGHTDRVLVLSGFSKAVGLGAQAYTYTGGTFTQRGSTVTSFPAGSFVYFRITRDGSNNVSFYVSANGMLWSLIATQAFTFTVGEIGFRFNNTGAGDVRAIVDWLRTDV